MCMVPSSELAWGIPTSCVPGILSESDWDYDKLMINNYTITKVQL